MKKNRILVLAVICAVAVIFISNPQKYMDSFTNGLTVWALSVVPALFPFFFLSKLLIELDFVRNISSYAAPVTKKLFKAPEISGYIFLISILSGYPVGAKLIEEYYEKGLVSTEECKKIATFTSTSGPLFILGTVGGKFFGNSSLGWVLLGCHMLSALLTGLLFRGFFNGGATLLNKGALPVKKTVSKNVLNDAVYSSVMSILSVGTFISISYILVDMLLSASVFKVLPGSVSAFVAGLLEVTRGCREISLLGLNLNAAAVLSGFLISFGGFCIMLQSLCFLSKCGVGFKNILAVKSVQASVAGVLTALFLVIFPL